MTGHLRLLLISFCIIGIARYSLADVTLDLTGYLTNKSNGLGYKLIYKAENWTVARERCAGAGAKLAVPKSQEEFAFIQKIVRGMQFPQIIGASNRLFVWLGINNLDNYLEWKNVDGENINDTGYHTWTGQNGIPFSDNPREPHCVVIDAVNPGLRDYWCHLKQPYICQISLSR